MFEFCCLHGEYVELHAPSSYGLDELLVLMTGELQVGEICITLIAVKSSCVVVTSLLSAVHISASLGHAIHYHEF